MKIAVLAGAFLATHIVCADPLVPAAVTSDWWQVRFKAKQAEIAALKGEVDLVFAGDSITHIWESRCPEILMELKRSYTLLNIGYSGDKVENLNWRFEHGELDGYRAKCVMLLIGTNNPRSEYAKTAQGIRRALDIIAEKQPQAKTLLLPVFPRRDSPDGPEGKPFPRPEHGKLNELIRAFADGEKVIWVEFGGEYVDADGDTRWIMPDRLHPGAMGLGMWYDRVKPLFRAICGGAEPPRTAGWENVDPARRELPLPPSVWRARTSDGGFTLEKRDGAEGAFRIVDGVLEIRKTNDRGALLLKAPSFDSPTNRLLMFAADLSVDGATPEYSHGFLRAHGKTECLTLQPEALARGRLAGWPEASGLVNTAPGMSYRKYSYYRSEDGTVRPVLVVAGAPSVSRWTDWQAVDAREADGFWHANCRDPEVTPKRLKPELPSDAEFDAMIARDVQHTAKIERTGNGARLLIDGRPAIPSVYEGMRHLVDYTEIGDARGLIAAGVPIAGPIVLGAAGESQAASVTWTKAGYDAKKAVDLVRETMRGSGKALAMVQYSCNAYPEFTTEEHPDDVWLDQDGNPIVGTWGSSAVGYNGYDARTKVWPWPSMASRAWREAVCANIRAFVAEMKRRGLDKRLVAIHFCGYNDGQFGMNRPDFSPCAKAEYARYLKEVGGTGLSTNYWHFCRQLNARAVEEFGRAFKTAMGKDVLVLRRCDSPFVVDFAFGANMRSDVIDVTVTGPTYEYRSPSIGCATYVPFSSLAANGKMLWNEFDLRTWWIRQAHGYVGHRQNNSYDDLACWQAGYRKLAGEMIAARGGYWFYDMGRGWFSGKGIPEDVADSFRTFRGLLGKDPSPWKPEVAIVVDEEGHFGFGGPKCGFPTYEIVERQMLLLSNAGVPYEYLLAEDVLRNPERLKGKKAVFLLLWRMFDERRTAFVKRLAEKVPTLVFLGECGLLGGVGAATGFDVRFDWGERSYRQVPERMMKESVLGFLEAQACRGTEFGANPDRPIPVPSGRRGSIAETPGVVPLARFADDGSVSIAMRRDGGCRRVYVSEPAGLSPGFFNSLARKAGAYVPVVPSAAQVNMNGDFVSVHALRSGALDFRLPFPCRVTNVKSGREEPTRGGVLPLTLTAGETCWFLLERD